MKLFTVLAVCLTAIVIGGAGGGAAIGVARNSAYEKQVADLRGVWERDLAQGVPAASINPLRTELDSRQARSWWSPDWVRDDGLGPIASLRQRTDAAWNSALDEAHVQAQQSIDEWAAFATQAGSWVTADATAKAAAWPAQAAAATTPAQLTQLGKQWHQFIADQHVAVLAAQRAKLDEELAAAGGEQAVLAIAVKLARFAQSVNLDDAGVWSLATKLKALIDSGGDPQQTAGDLVAAISKLRQLVDLNNSVASQVRPLYLTVLQMLAEGTPNQTALNARYNALDSQFGAARTTEQVTAVSVSLGALHTDVTAELTTNQCGHAVGDGKVITVSLALQEMVFYESGCAVRATPVTTGRPTLRTPAGHWHIFYKTSPFTMVSPWPKSSPYWYPTTPVAQVMEFLSGGYFIHDADWEAVGAYGPGSEDNLGAASHGCIHVPTTTMRWVYSWAPVGTPVTISN